RSHWVMLARRAEGKDPLAHLAKLREVVRWQRDADQLSCLGVACFSPRLAAGLAYAIQRVIDREGAEVESGVPLQREVARAGELAEQIAKGKAGSTRDVENGPKLVREGIDRIVAALDSLRQEVDEDLDRIRGLYRG